MHNRPPIISKPYPNNTMIIIKLSINPDNVQTAIAFFTMQEVIKKHGIHDLQVQLAIGLLLVYSTDNSTGDLLKLIAENITHDVIYANYDDSVPETLNSF